MSGYLGSYLHQLDEKGRVSLPAAFRGEEEGSSFVLVHAHPDALTLYPEAAWSSVEARLLELLRVDPRARPYVLGVTANAIEVTPDRQGRILVPQRLQEGVGLNGAALVVGVIDRIEVWSPERFRSQVERPVSEIEEFTHRVFG
jgi:MraZ protein